MQKLGLSTMKSLDHLRTLKKSTPIMIPSPPPPDSVFYGSFATLKNTAEKLIQEQVAVKTDLEMAHKKLIRATEQIRTLEGKLQESVNDNSRLKTKATEDAKLWSEIDSRIISTQTLCDQLNETLQQLTDQTRVAEEDKTFFEEKLAENSKAFEDTNSQLNSLSSMLDSAGNTIRTGEEKILELKNEKEEMENQARDERRESDNIIKGKDALIKQLEDVIEENKKQLLTVASHLHEAEHELTLKEEIFSSLKASEEALQNEKHDLECNNQSLSLQLGKSVQEFKELQRVVSNLSTKIVELDKESITVSNHFAKMIYVSEKYYGLAHQEKVLALKNAQNNYDKLQKEHMQLISDNGNLKAETEELNCKILELQKSQEFIIVQHAEECRLSEDNYRKLESEVEIHVSKNNELERSATDLRNKIKDLSEAATASENNVQELLQKISSLESDNSNLEAKLQLALQEKSDEASALKEKIMKQDQHVESLEKQISDLQIVLNEKEQLHTRFSKKEKDLEERNVKVHASLLTAESKLTEERKQFELMLEAKNLELSKHLKELSQRNDLAINEIRRKYEEEKVEVANIEKEKANKLIKEMEKKYEGKFLEQKQDIQQSLLQAEKEHAAMISKIQKDYDQKEASLQAHHKEEMQRLELHAENEMREKTSLLRREHEIQFKSLKLQYDDDCKRLQEELELQRSKEEKQRALLQLQWKVISESQQDDHEVNSKKEYSVSSIKKVDPYGGKDRHVPLTSPEPRRKDVSISGLMRTPVENLLKKGSSANVPKHRKITRHEYEVETSNGQTVTKRKKTKSTVQYGGSNSQKAAHSKPPSAMENMNKMSKVSGVVDQPKPANLGDLFSEGSLNPYNDDPYAFN